MSKSNTAAMFNFRTLFYFSVLFLVFTSCYTDQDDDMILENSSVSNEKANILYLPPNHRPVRMKSNPPTFLKGKTVEVIRPSWIRNNPALNKPLIDAMTTLNSIAGFDVEFSARIPSSHKLRFSRITNQLTNSTCYGRAVDIFQGNATASSTSITIDDEVELQNYMVVRSFFIHEIMHTLGFEHPDDTRYPIVCSRPDNWTGVMELCVCSDSGNSITCRNITPNQCEAQILAAKY